MKPITELTEMQSIELEIMNTVHKYCINHGIKYFLSYGTLIGAIRHDGFIPWDDDIDIFMPRDDYDRFCKSFNFENDNKNYELVNHTTKTYFGRPMSKIIDNRTFLVENEFNGDDPIGVFVDIWPLDGVPTNEFSRKKHIFHAEFLRKLMYLKIKKSTRISLIQKILKVFVLPIPSKWIVKRLNSVIKKYPYSDSKYVKCYLDPYHAILDKDWFLNTTTHKYEDKEFLIPSGYDDILRSLYGNYMELPPKEKQIPHHIVSTYWK